MTTLWLYHPEGPSSVKPLIGCQANMISDEVLHLRNPTVLNSVLLGKMYTGMTLIFTIMVYWTFFRNGFPAGRSIELTATILCSPFILLPLLAHRLVFIKNVSDFYFNRITQKFYHQQFGKPRIFEWSNMRGGVFISDDFGGSCISATYALAFAPCRSDGSAHFDDGFWVEGNKPGGMDAYYVAEVWEYLRHFMDHGPKKLPPPSQPSWWFKPIHKIYLTPAEAWHHYVPWRTGEFGEERGKKLCLFPFWAALLPYNLAVAICWYLICRAFKIETAPPPSGALTKTPARKKTNKR